MQSVIAPRPLSGPALLAHYGVKLIHELAHVPALRKTMLAVARANRLGPIHSFYLTRTRGAAWDGETERLLIIGTSGYAELSLPSERIACVGTLYSMGQQARLPLHDAGAAVDVVHGSKYAQYIGRSKRAAAAGNAA